MGAFFQWLEKGLRIFPMVGKSARGFSNGWKNGGCGRGGRRRDAAAVKSEKGGRDVRDTRDEWDKRDGAGGAGKWVALGGAGGVEWGDVMAVAELSKE